MKKPPRAACASMRQRRRSVALRSYQRRFTHQVRQSASPTGQACHRVRPMAKWGVLAVLAAAQFLMVLDQAVMNVSISQLVEDFDTTVTTIQIVIALYALVMAALMLTGGKLGDIYGRRRAS